MKKIVLFTVLFISFITFAQVPQGISYQAIALNGSGTPVVSSNVGVRLSILNTSASGAVLYSETQTKTTNAQGLFNLVIGQGTLVSGAFNTINWGSGTKYLKVEMDAAGGTNYVLVGTTQLLSVPYALAADSLVTSAGEGITLVSPNGTPYTLSVNDAGVLSLPTSNSSGSFPNQFYTYGTFNSFNASSALLMGSDGFGFYGYKYLTSGSQIKFLAENNTSSAIYGLNASYEVVQNGSAYTVPSNGFYSFGISIQEGFLAFSSTSMAPSLYFPQSGNSANGTYTVATNKFSFTVTGVTTTSNNNSFYFQYINNGQSYGDNLADGSVEYNGTPISFPNVTSTPKNFRVDLTINFNGSGDYTITQLP